MPESRTVAWLCNQPTPQLTPVVNSLARTFNMHAVYRDRDSDGRGWGDLPLEHQHTVLTAAEAASVRAGFRFIRHTEPDAVVAFGYSARFSMGALLAARLGRIPVLTQSDSDWGVEQSKRLPWRILKRAFLGVLYSAKNTTAVAISASNRAYWQHYGMKHFTDIPFESPVPEPSSAGTSAEDSSGLPRRYVLFVGRLIDLKRPMDAVAAVEQARVVLPDLELVIVGEGDALGADLPTWVHRHGARPQSELGAYYAGAAALVVTSAQEAYGLVVREALQFGTPVVGYRTVPAIAELCPTGWNHVAFGDTARLAEALVRAVHEGRWRPRPPVDTAPTYARVLTDLITRPRQRG